MPQPQQPHPQPLPAVRKLRRALGASQPIAEMATSTRLRRPTRCAARRKLHHRRRPTAARHSPRLHPITERLELSPPSRHHCHADRRLLHRPRRRNHQPTACVVLSTVAVRGSMAPIIAGGSPLPTSLPTRTPTPQHQHGRRQRRPDDGRAILLLVILHRHDMFALGASSSPAPPS